MEGTLRARINTGHILDFYRRILQQAYGRAVLTAGFINKEVVQGLGQPGAGLLQTAKLVEAGDHSHEQFLHEVLGIFPPAAEAVSQPVQAIHMRRNDRLKAITITGFS